MGASFITVNSIFFTIGHSNRTLEKFIELLQSVEADIVVDVRSIPRSRANPQYNRDSLPADLERQGIAYRHIESLGGRRSRSEPDGNDVNAFWENASFHNYADHALTEEFRDGLRELLALGSDHRPAIMCAEAVWWRCHRRIIADYLLESGASVRHIMDVDKIVPAKKTEAAMRDGELRLVYPAPVG